MSDGFSDVLDVHFRDLWDAYEFDPPKPKGRIHMGKIVYGRPKSSRPIPTLSSTATAIISSTTTTNGTVPTWVYLPTSK